MLSNFKYFQIILEDLELYSIFEKLTKEVENMRRIWNWKFQFRKKNLLWYRYRNWTLVLVPDTDWNLVLVVHQARSVLETINNLDTFSFQSIRLVPEITTALFCHLFIAKCVFFYNSWENLSISVPLCVCNLVDSISFF